MAKTKIILLYLISVFFMFGCKESFEPNLPSLKERYLVVEGFINANGTTQIKLSRTVPLQQNGSVAELNARVSVESDDNSSFILGNVGPGLYSTSSVPINVNKKYRLRIKTANNQEYLSQFVNVKVAPAIDSINFKQEGKDVQLYVNTHDPQKKSIYYRWDYDETWEINSLYDPVYIYANGNIRRRVSSDPQTFYCWKNASSNSIIIGSSAKLIEDRIFLQPIKLVERADERLGVRYSILVRQYVLEKEGYEFYEQMKKNTESLGTIFDPQPSALRGNVQCISNPNELVIGYVGATSVYEKRMFISAGQLTGNGFRITDYCESGKVKNHPDSIKAVIPASYLPYDAEMSPISPAIINYFVSSPTCIDCRLRGGNNSKPSYW